MIVHERRREDRETDERYRQLVEMAPDGILVHDGERIILANASAVRLAGATRHAQLVGQPIESFLDPPYLKAVQSELTDAVSPTEPAPPVRDTFHRLDGSDVPVVVRAVAFMDHGRPSAHLVVRDITERLAAEEADRRVNERLQEAQRLEAVGTLAGGVAHEVNNMMQVIQGFSDLLLGGDRLPEGCRSDVREIIRAADRAAAVTRQLLAFSRRAAHRPEVTDLAKAIRDGEPMLRRLLGEGRWLMVAVDAAPRVKVDPGQLQQVLIALALNARDAMPAGGTAFLTTNEIELAESLPGANGATIIPGRYATVEVRDTGVGMDAATLARAFEPFFTTKPLGRGTGLGLAAALGMLTQNQGHITVFSEPGQGAVFTLYLPIVAQAAVVEESAQPAGAVGEPSLAGSTVLVVDDEPALRSVTARILERGGFTVLRAPDGFAALEQVDHHGPPDLVLTDLMMPEMSGAELARRLREHWPALPVLFMSGYSAEELLGQGAVVAETDLLQKPFTAAGLVERVRAAGVGSSRRPAPTEASVPRDPV